MKSTTLLRSISLAFAVASVALTSGCISVKREVEPTSTTTTRTTVSSPVMPSSTTVERTTTY